MALPPETLLGWVGFLIAIAGGLRAFGYLKGVPIPKKKAGAIALVGLVLFLYGEGYIQGKPATMVKGEEPVLATFEVDVASIPSGVTYDEDSQTFTVAVQYDSVNDAISPQNLTFVFTVYRTDLGTEDAVAKVVVENVEWYEDINKYTLLEQALVTPEGASSTKDEGLVFLPAASSKSVTITVTLDKEAIKSLDIYGSKSFTIQIAGETFTVNVIRTA